MAGSQFPGSGRAAPLRQRLDLDGAWRFVPDPDGLLAPATLPAGVPVEVPSCWESFVGAEQPLTTGWYRRSFRLPDDWAAPRTVLRFDAVSDEAGVWLNDRHLGGHEGAYTRFELTASEALRRGENELVVRAHNPAGAIVAYPVLSLPDLLAVERGHPGAAGLSERPVGKQTWYASMSGIWRSVSLEGRPDGALSSLGVTPEGTSGRVVVDWTRDSGPSATAIGSALRLTIFDANGTDVATMTLPQPGTAGRAVVVVDTPRLWDVDDPHRYRLLAELVQDGRPVDALDRWFGIRSISTAGGQVTLNGRPLFVRGALDQDVFPDTLWVAGPRHALEAQLRAAKAMGLNLLRCHIKVPDPAYMDIADEIGLLVWAELPSWGRLTASSQERAARGLAEMVDQLGHHPSLAIWTIVNEDWGTDLTRVAQHRAWLRTMVTTLKGLDPTRLVVDNSPCWTPHGGNFHVSTDVADYHMYFGMPDHDDRWRAAIREFAGRPARLWSPHGDATTSDEEPLILSEFGGWGLPAPHATPLPGPGADTPGHAPLDTAPWWVTSGDGATRPAGAWQRFAALGLRRVAAGPAELAAATQWHQFEALQRSVAEMRRHPSLAGYVVTELTDAFWEANGLVHLDRSAKVFGDRLVDVLGPDTVFADPERWDWWAGSTIGAELLARSDVGRLTRPVVRWVLDAPGAEPRWGTVDLGVDGTGLASGRLTVEAPRVDRPVTARLALELVDEVRGTICRQEHRLVVAPAEARRTRGAVRLSFSGALAATALAARILGLGHEASDGGRLLVADRLDDRAVEHAREGGAVLAMLDAPDEGWPWVTRPGSTDGLVTARDLARPLEVHSRYDARDPVTHRPLRVDGDWVTLFSWADPTTFPGLPPGVLFDFAYRDVIPRVAILGADERTYATEVMAGGFVGWVADPVAWAWRFPEGRGQVTVSTLRLASDGPVATAMLDALVRGAATG